HRSITRPRRKRERGIALVIILVLMTVMMAMGIILSKDARTELRISRDEKLAKQAIATAEAGISHAVDVVKQAPIDLNGNLGRAGNAQRRVDALLHVGGIPGGIFGDLSVGFGGSGGLIDSYDSRVGPYNAASPGSHGDVGSNGGIDLASADIDHGNATAGGTV